MMLRRRLVPVAALVVAIGASAAGAATAAETGSGGKTGGAHEARKPGVCKVELGGKSVAKGSVAVGGDAAKAAAVKAAQAKIAQASGKGTTSGKGTVKTEPKGSPLPAKNCAKKVDVVSLDTVATELGVSKAALVQALDQTKQWIIASPDKPSVAQFEQHLADLLHVPVAKVASVFGAAQHLAVSSGA